MLDAAILGFGAIAAGRRGEVAYPMSHLAAYAALAERVRVVAVADPDRERRALAADLIPGVRTYPDADALFAAERPDVVSVCLPGARNCDALLAACSAGARAVWCEKPVAVSREQVARLRAALPAMPPVQVGFWRQFVPEIRALLAAVAAGEFGAVHLVTGCYAERYVGNGSHLVALAQAAVGVLDLHGARWAGEPDAAGDGPACIQACSRDGAVPVSFMPLPRRPYNVFEMEIWCERARVRLAGGGRRIERFGHVQDPDHPHLRILEETAMVERPRWKRAFESGLSDLLACIDGARTPAAALGDALDGAGFLLDVRERLAAAPAPAGGARP